MKKYEVIIEILGRKYKCKVKANNQPEACNEACAMMRSKIECISVDEIIEEPIQEIVDFDSIFSSMFNGFKPS